MSQTFHIVVRAENNGARLDKVLRGAMTGFSRARLQSLIREGHCTIRRAGASVLAEASLKLRAGDEIALVVPPIVESELLAQDIALDVLYEDEALLVLNKPAGLVVHPAAGNADGTLVNALLAHCGDSLSGIGGEKRPGIVHRLDKDTSGVMVVAKSDDAHKALQDQFRAHGRDGKLKRIYHAFVWGKIMPPLGTIDAALSRARFNRKKIAVSRAQDAREAITHYKELAHYGAVSRVACTLETGRTHQIRVHLAHIGHAVLGDTLYGAGMRASNKHLSEPQLDALTALARHALHACALGFVHPISGEALYFETPLPADLQALASALEGSGKPLKTG